MLFDEINRATPRTQSALLEAMQERQVSVDGETRPLPRPFVVLATQNPIELEGTFALPEAQLDRFLVRVELGYLDEVEERQMLRRLRDADEQLDAIEPVVSADELAGVQARGATGASSRTTSRLTCCRSSAPRANTPTSTWARARAARSRCTARRRHGRRSTAATS